MLFVQPKLLSTATPGRGAKDEKPETDEICDLHRSQERPACLGPGIDPARPHPIPPVQTGLTGEQASRLYDGYGSL